MRKKLKNIGEEGPIKDFPQKFGSKVSLFRSSPEKNPTNKPYMSRLAKTLPLMLFFWLLYYFFRY